MQNTEVCPGNIERAHGFLFMFLGGVFFCFFKDVIGEAPEWEIF